MKQQWRRGWQVWPALNLLRLLCGLSAPNEALFLLLLKLNTVFDSSLPKPQWSCVKISLWRRDSLSHGSHICSGSWLSGRGCQCRGSVYSSVLHGMKILLFVPNSTVLTYAHYDVFEVQLLSPHLAGNANQVVFLHQGVFKVLVELVLGSDPRGGVGLGRGALPVPAFLPSSGTRTITPSPSLLAAVFKKDPCRSVHLLQQQSLLLREQDPCTGYFFTQDLLMLFLLLF